MNENKILFILKKKLIPVLLLFLYLSFTFEIPGDKDCSKPKLYTRVAFVEGTENQLNSDYAFKTKDQWLEEISSNVINELRSLAGGEVEIIPLEKAVFIDDIPETPQVENLFNETSDGEYHLDFSLGVITQRNSMTGVRDESLHPAYSASVSIGDGAEGGIYISSLNIENVDLYAAIRSSLYRASERGLPYLIEQYEKTHFNALRNPEIELNMLSPKVVSPEPAEREVSIIAITRDCRNLFGEGTILRVKKETNRGSITIKRSYKEMIHVDGYWKTRTTADGAIEFVFKLERGIEPGFQEVEVYHNGRGNKKVTKIISIPVKGLKMNIKPERNRLSPGEQTKINIQLFTIDPQGVSEPLSDCRVTIQTNGLVDGKLTPHNEITTDDNGSATLIYQAGASDKNLRIIAVYQPDNYPDKVEGECEINGGAYKVTFDLEISEPYVPDGRMPISKLIMQVVFDEVYIEPPDPSNPLSMTVDIDASEGYGKFIKFELGRSWVYDNVTEQPHFIKPPPESFGATLVMNTDFENLNNNQKNIAPPAKAKLSFFTDLSLMAITWANSVGSSGFDNFDLMLTFEVPWQDLLQGKPVTLSIPYNEYEGRENSNGTWIIKFQRH